MGTYWVGIAGKPTPEQRERLSAAGLVERGHSGDAFSGTIHRTYFLVKAPDGDGATDQVAAVLPELRQKWEESPPHLIVVTNP